MSQFLEDRYQALVSRYYETGKSPLPCTALSSSCFVDAYWNLYACSIWDAKVGNLRDNAFVQPKLVDAFLRPDVLEAIEEARAESNRPHKRHHRRDGKKIGEDVPDLKFRWRTSGGARQPQGR